MAVKITVVYVYPMFGGVHDNYAARFAASYSLNPPGMEHKTVVVTNGGKPTGFSRMMFSELSPDFFEHDNSGWDIGAYQAVAATLDCEMMVCFGQSIYFTRPGWLFRMATEWNRRGPGFYSGSASNDIRPHLQTTGFWCIPGLLLQYPRVTNHGQRYEFEHGGNPIWKVAQSMGLPARLVTWDGCYGPSNWRRAVNGFWNGDQSNMLYWNNHTDGYNNDPKNQLRLRMVADGSR